MDVNKISELLAMVNVRGEILHQETEKVINVLTLTMYGECYAFLYDDESWEEILMALGRFASNPELSFNWYSEAVLAQKIRQKKER